MENHELWGCLRPKLWDRVTIMEIKDFAKLANKVKIAEETLKACKVESAQKKMKRGALMNILRVR